MKIVLKVIKYAIAVIFIGLFSFMCFRVISSGDTKISKTYLWTDEAKASYLFSPEDFHIYKVSVPQEFTNDGQFFITNIRYSTCEKDELSEFQFTIRYNDSTLKYLCEYYGIEESPGIGHFVYTLGDDAGHIYDDYEIIYDERFNYNYERMVFSGIDMTGVNSIYVNIYYDKEYNGESAAEVMSGYDSGAYGTMTVYTEERDASEYKLKGDEIPK